MKITEINSVNNIVFHNRLCKNRKLSKPQESLKKRQEFKVPPKIQSISKKIFNVIISILDTF